MEPEQFEVSQRTTFCQQETLVYKMIDLSSPRASSAHRESDATQAIPWEKPKYMAKANYMAKVRVSGICHWMAFASVLWQNPGRLQKVTSMGFVMEWLLPYNKHNRFSQLYIAFFDIISEMKHQINCKRLQIFSKYTHHVL